VSETPSYLLVAPPECDPFSRNKLVPQPISNQVRFYTALPTHFVGGAIAYTTQRALIVKIASVTYRD
jgi:hypothetical protein